MSRGFIYLCLVLAPCSAWCDWALSEGFESEELLGWQTGRDLPQDPNNPGHEVGWEVSASTDRAYRGDRSLRLFIDGRQDDGTVWVARSLPVASGSEVQLQLRFWSPFKGSANNLAYAVGYIGRRAPENEQDFVRIAPVADVGEWDLLVLTDTVRHDASMDDEIWIAVGFTVVWETKQTYYIDDVRVDTTSAGRTTAVEQQRWGAMKSRWRVRAP